MKGLLSFVAVLAFAFPVWGQSMGGDPPPDEPPTDEPPPVEPPPDEPPPDEMPPDEPPPDDDPTNMDPEKVRLRLVEKEAIKLANDLRVRMESAKTNSERGLAISDIATLGCIHPIMAKAYLPYLNPRPIKPGMQYDDLVHLAACDALAKLPFDETYYGASKWMKGNMLNFTFVERIIKLFGEMKAVKAIPDLIKFLEDKREPQQQYLERARLSIDALGRIGHRDAISPLVKELELQDKAGINDEKNQQRRLVLRTYILQALEDMTTEKFKTGVDWRVWWNQNQETFQREKKKPEGEEDPGGEE